MEEEFKPIEGYHKYSVSDKGAVINIHTGRQLKALDNGRGYMRVYLFKKGKGTQHYVHRLVAMAFLPNLDNFPIVNHKDEVKTNNHIDNLEWCTAQYNIEYSLAKHYTLKSSEGEVVEVFNMTKFCRDNNLNTGHMRSVLNGSRRHHKGWRRNYG